MIAKDAECSLHDRVQMEEPNKQSSGLKVMDTWCQDGIKVLSLGRCR